MVLGQQPDHSMDEDKAVIFPDSLYDNGIARIEKMEWDDYSGGRGSGADRKMNRKSLAMKQLQESHDWQYIEHNTNRT